MLIHSSRLLLLSHVCTPLVSLVSLFSLELSVAHFLPLSLSLSFSGSDSLSIGLSLEYLDASQSQHLSLSC